MPFNMAPPAAPDNTTFRLFAITGLATADALIKAPAADTVAPGIKSVDAATPTAINPKANIPVPCVDPEDELSKLDAVIVCCPATGSI